MIFWRMRWPICIMIIIFGLPVLGAFCAAKYREHLAFPSYGRFSEPPLEVNIDNAEILAGTEKKNKWIIIALKFHDDAIDQNNLEMLQKLHTALGARRESVTIVRKEPSELYPAFRLSPLLILNPQQMCIMKYNKRDFEGLLKDMRKLLKYSHV